MSSLLARDFRLPFPPWWSVWGMALALGYLIPNRSVPWLLFDREVLTVGCGVALIAGLLLKYPERWQVPAASLVVLALALVPPLQWAGGLLYFRGDAWMSSLFLLGFALAIAAGAAAARACGSRLTDALFGAFLVASIGSVAIALYQWQQQDWADYLVIVLPAGQRPFSNLGQPNHLATLIGWGLVGLWWFFLRNHVGALVALATATFLLFGLAMTQSRTAWVFLVVLLLGAWGYRQRLRSEHCWRALAALTALFVFFVLTWGPLNRALHFDLSEGLGQRLQPGTRLHHWTEILTAIADRPWFGWGWNQVSVAQQGVALRFPTAPEVIDQSHNLVLDLLVSNGLLIGVPLVVAGAWWLISLVRRVDTVQGILSLLAVAVFLSHAMLEFPHTYAYFLLPAGLLLGTACALCAPARHWVASRKLVATITLAATVAFAWTAVEYYRAKHDLEALRFELARIGTSRNSVTPPFMLLTQLQAFLEVNRYKISEVATPDRLELMRKVSERYPQHLFQLRYAMAAASVGQSEVARDTLARLCRLQSAEDCKNDLLAWRELARTTYPYLKPVQLPISETKQ